MCMYVWCLLAAHLITACGLTAWQTAYNLWQFSGQRSQSQTEWNSNDISHGRKQVLSSVVHVDMQWGGKKGSVHLRNRCSRGKFVQDGVSPQILGEMERKSSLVCRSNTHVHTYNPIRADRCCVSLSLFLFSQPTSFFRTALRFRPTGSDLWTEGTTRTASTTGLSSDWTHRSTRRSRTDSGWGSRCRVRETEERSSSALTGKKTLGRVVINQSINQSNGNTKGGKIHHWSHHYLLDTIYVGTVYRTYRQQYKRW